MPKWTKGIAALNSTTDRRRFRQPATLPWQTGRHRNLVIGLRHEYHMTILYLLLAGVLGLLLSLLAWSPLNPNRRRASRPPHMTAGRRRRLPSTIAPSVMTCLRLSRSAATTGTSPDGNC